MNGNLIWHWCAEAQRTEDVFLSSRSRRGVRFSVPTFFNAAHIDIKARHREELQIKASRWHMYSSCSRSAWTSLTSLWEENLNSEDELWGLNTFRVKRFFLHFLKIRMCIPLVHCAERYSSGSQPFICLFKQKHWIQGVPRHCTVFVENAFKV